MRPAKTVVALVLTGGLLLVGGRVWGENPCGTCHEEQPAAVAHTVHGRVAGQSSAFCSACHGDGEAHMASGEAKDIVGSEALAKANPEQKAKACLQCHQATWPSWQSGVHARQGVSCWDCHGDVWHQSNALAGKGSELSRCTQCHEGVSVEFRRPFRHPVREQQVTCVSCHDVHGNEQIQEVTVERCRSCHPQAAGPFVFPHRAMDEGCSACHAPHGSVNRSLLRTSGNGLCVRCHLQSNFPGVGKIPHNFNLMGGARCYDCHSEAHGSNVDELFAPRLSR